jgi:glycosyltransferase involved in cell wall biosynthesis
MISVVIATSDSERALVPTLAALVPGAVVGTIREVIIADANSRDGTAAVADVAGCRLLQVPGGLGAQLKAGAAAARAPWLLFLRPGVVPDVGWIDEVGRFMQDAALSPHTHKQAAVFRRAVAAGSRPLLVEAASLVAAALGSRRRPEQGLLIAKALYRAVGGHRAEVPHPEAELLRRLGRGRIVTLRTAALAR